MFFMKASRGRESLKCKLPLKTWKQGDRFHIRACFSVTTPSVLPIHMATSSHMGGRSPSPAAPHTKRRWRRESSTNLKFGADEEGEVNAAPTPAATTPCRDYAKTWMV